MDALKIVSVTSGAVAALMVIMAFVLWLLWRKEGCDPENAKELKTFYWNMWGLLISSVTIGMTFGLALASLLRRYARMNEGCVILVSGFAGAAVLILCTFKWLFPYFFRKERKKGRRHRGGQHLQSLMPPHPQICTGRKASLTENGLFYFPTFQAIAIGLSKARRAGAKVPRR